MSAKVTGSPFGDCSRLPLGLEAGEGGGGQFGQYALGFHVIPASLASGVLTSAPCLYSPVSELRTHTLHMRRQRIALGLHLLQLSPVDHLFHGCIPLSLQLLQLPQQARPVTAQRVDLVVQCHAAHCCSSPSAAARAARALGAISKPCPGSKPFSARNSMISMAARSSSSY